MANYRALAAAAARRYGIPVDVFLRQINQESGFNPRARSSAGAQGIAQIVPRFHPGVDPFNPGQALNYAARMDASNLRKYGNWRDVLSVYNSGRPFAQGRGIPETSNYVRSILGGASPAVGAAPRTGAVGFPSSSPAAPDLSGTRAALAQNLIAASQASAAGQTPDYSQTFSLVAALRTPGASRPLPVLVQGGVPRGLAQSAVKTAERYLGTAYKWGGSSPKTGFDCSGLLQWSWAHAGVRIPRTSQQQFRAGVPVGRGQLQAGDAVFFEGGPGGPGHVGMMIDRTHFIESPHTGAVVRISTLRGRGDFVGARRFR